MNTFPKEPVIGIDLGASFTKVSYRPKWYNHKERFEAPTKILMIEDKPMVPSIVVRCGSKGRWLLGAEAAQYTRLDGDIEFPNWKSKLFSDTLGIGESDAVTAAGKFFEWLRGKVANIVPNLDSCRVKVCIPDFQNVEKPAEIIARQMMFAGWTNVSLSRVSEPRANTVGVFAEGRNTMYNPENPNPVFREIYPEGSAMLLHLRNYARGNGAQYSTAVLLDIGSYTTDLSIVTIDARSDGDCINSTRQKSYKLGIIDDFETPLLKALSERHGFDVEQLSFNDRENLKTKLANEERFGFDLIGNDQQGERNVSLGDEADKVEIRAISKRFAGRAAQHFLEFLKTSIPNYFLLTGGGSAAPVLRDALKAEFSSCGVKVAEFDGMETKTGERGLLRGWPDAGEPLCRLATALGAGSVVLDLNNDKSAAAARPTRVELPWVVCSCSGGNKDCMRCGGMGSYRTD